MKKIVLVSTVVALLFLTAIGVCFTAGAVEIPSQQATQSQKIETAGKGTIKGTITNQNGKPVAFVRVIAVGRPQGNQTLLGFTITHLLNGKGTYSMSVPAGRYLFLRASRLPLYLGAWAGPVVVTEGGTVTLDLSITYIGPKSTPVVVPSGQILDYGRLLNLLNSKIILN